MENNTKAIVTEIRDVRYLVSFIIILCFL